MKTKEMYDEQRAQIYAEIDICKTFLEDSEESLEEAYEIKRKAIFDYALGSIDEIEFKRIIIKTDVDIYNSLFLIAKDQFEIDVCEVAMKQINTMEKFNDDNTSLEERKNCFIELINCEIEYDELINKYKLVNSNIKRKFKKKQKEEMKLPLSKDVSPILNMEDEKYEKYRCKIKTKKLKEEKPVLIRINWT